MRIAQVNIMRIKKDRRRKINFLVVCILVFSALVSPVFVFSDTDKQGAEKIVMLVFGGITCPNCIAQKPFLNDLEKRYNLLEIKHYEVYNSKPNRELFARTALEHGIKAGSVPAVFVAGKHFIGDTPTIRKQIEQAVKQAIDAVQKQKPPTGKTVIDKPAAAGSSPITTNQQNRGQSPIPPSSSLPAPECDEQAKACKVEAEADPWLEGGLQDGRTPSVKGTLLPDREKKTLADTADAAASKTILDIPFLGAVDMAQHSLFLSTVLISFVDGFNPCSLWVLMLLLGMVLHSGSRQRVILVGVVFLFTTAAVYGVFIAGIFKILTVLSFVWWIQWIVAIFAFVFGAVNIKDYFWFKKGFSFSISDDKKPGIYKSIRGLMNPKNSGLSLVWFTVVMAAGTSIVEIPCTAGLPVVWSELLRIQQVGWLKFYSLLFVYLLVYLSLAIAIFLVAVFTMKMGRFEEKYGQLLKLIGGSIMVALALVLILKPGLMNDITGMFLVFAGSALASAVLVFIKKYFLKG